MKIKISKALQKEFFILSESKEFNPKDFIKFIVSQSYYKKLLEIEYNLLLKKYLVLKMVLPNFNKLLTLIKGEK